MNLKTTLSDTQWQWCENDNLLYLTCNLLKAWKHGFFSRQAEGRSPSELGEILNSDAKSYQLQQVHGNIILTPSEINIFANNKGEKKVSAGDGIISETANQCLWVASADCTPVLMADSVTGRVAAIHAGWRGTARKIVPEAIALFYRFGSNKDNLLFALGPAISGKVYQVSEEVAIEVGRSIITGEETQEGGNVLQNLTEMVESPLGKDSEPGKVRLDIRRVISLQLEQLGIAKEQIAIAPYCTYQLPDYFFSYRRTQEKKIQWSGIVSN
jgi:YfiH family protein